MCLGCSRVRESPCRVAGLVFRTKRTTASEPANHGPRSRPRLPTAQTQTTPEQPTVITRMGQGWWALPPRPPEIYRFGANPGEIPTETGRRSRVGGRPVSGLGSWHGARVASPRGPVLRSGHWSCYPRSPRGASSGARGPRAITVSLTVRAAQSRESLDERQQRRTGRVLSRTDCSGCVIRDPERSSSPPVLLFGRNLRKLTSPTTRS